MGSEESQDDREIEALRRAWGVLAELEPAARRRVAGYLQDRCATLDRGTGTAAHGAEAPDVVRSGAAPARLSREWRATMADRLASGALEVIADRILAAAGLLQMENPGRDFSAREIHQPLKHLGQPVQNISSHLRSIAGKQRGRWIIQVERSQSGHKRYMVTKNGVARARALLDLPDQAAGRSRD